MNNKTNNHSKWRSWSAMLMTGVLLMSIAFVAVTFFELTRKAKDERQWMDLSTTVQIASQQLSKSAGEAAAGNLEAFGELSATHDKIASAMRSLAAGNTSASLPAVPARIHGDVALLNQTWNRISTNSSSITERETLLLEMTESNNEFSVIIPDLQAAADASVRRLVESGAANQQVFAASQQLVLADRMLRRVGDILQGGSNAVNAANNLRNEINLFDQVLKALLNGSQSLGISQVRNQQALTELNRARRQFNAAQPHLAAILESSSDLFEVRGAADEIFLDSRVIYDQAGALSEKISMLPDSRLWPSLKTGVIGLAIMFAVAIVLVLYVIGAERRRATVATSANRKHQKAILQLLDELSSLADGDLTVHASVHNDMTGAIADAVNYAVERLRELVMAINDTANSVAESAQATRSSASNLAQASEHQARQIDSATESIKEMADSFDGMAEKSVESRATAEKSVNMAHQGAEKVRESIAGMDSIRDQIQKTSKRLKRLGESSQEIGDIISLINGFAEQTNVLALNAAIQAASAGGAGKGFAIVADEVQQLAESATTATRQIESLVQTIQADTSEAVVSMEETTSQVVSGTMLAEDAGASLSQIEKVSNDLSSLIQGITSVAQEHSEEATRLSEQMHLIRDVSVSTATGSKQAAANVEDLAELVLHLRSTVDDFKLPSSDD